MTTQKQRVPALRFPGFSGEWEEKMLSSFLEFKNGLNAGKESYGRGYKFINVLDIIENNYIIHDVIIGSVDVSESDFRKNIVEYGDILFQRSSETRKEVGQANVYMDKETPATFGGFVIRGKKIAEYDPFFMNYLLKTSVVRKDITTRSGGSTRYNIGQDSLSKISIDIPLDDEQKKIASFLSSVDTKIEQLTKKKAKLEKYKKGIMQKLFSQEIRFKDDEGKEFSEWEEKPISQALTIGSGKDYKHLGIGEIPVYGTGGFMRYVDDFLCDGESVCIGRKGTIDKPMFLNGKFWTVDTLFYTHSFVNAIPKYIYYIFQSIDWKSYNEASGVPSLSKKTIDKIIINIPSPLEQRKIADLLSSIDNKIEQVTNELEKTKTFKNGLLQQMFV